MSENYIFTLLPYLYLFQFQKNVNFCVKPKENPTEGERVKNKLYYERKTSVFH